MQAALGDRSSAESFCESDDRSARTIRIPAALLCLDAGTRAFIDERTEERDSFKGGAGVEAESVESDARKEKARLEWATIADFPERI